MTESAEERLLRERANDVTDTALERAGELLDLAIAYEAVDERGRLHTGFRDETAEQCLAHVALLDAVIRRLTYEIGDLVYNGRQTYGREMSWARIGAALGVTKQAAWDRFDKLSPGESGDPFDPSDELWTALPVYPTEAAYAAAYPGGGWRAEEGVVVDEDGIRWRLTLVAAAAAAATGGTGGSEGRWREQAGLVRGQVIAIALESPDAPRYAVVSVAADGRRLLNDNGSVQVELVDAAERRGAYPGTVRVLAADVDLFEARTIIGANRRRPLPALAVALSEAGDTTHPGDTAASGSTPATSATPGEA